MPANAFYGRHVPQRNPGRNTLWASTPDLARVFGTLAMLVAATPLWADSVTVSSTNSQPVTSFRRDADIINAPLVLRDGTPAGHVTHLVYGPENLDYILVAEGYRHVLVPFRATAYAAPGALRVDLSATDFATVPTFGTGTFPDVTSSDYREQLASAFETPSHSSTELKPSGPFSLVGETIQGSFELRPIVKATPAGEQPISAEAALRGVANSTSAITSGPIVVIPTGPAAAAPNGVSQNNAGVTTQGVGTSGFAVPSGRTTAGSAATAAGGYAPSAQFPNASPRMSATPSSPLLILNGGVTAPRGNPGIRGGTNQGLTITPTGPVTTTTSGGATIRNFGTPPALPGRVPTTSVPGAPASTTGTSGTPGAPRR